MNPNTEIETDRLVLRPWNLSEEDRSCFHFLMSDKQVRQFYPTRKTRSDADALLENLVSSYRYAAFTWIAACLKETGQPVGFTGLAKVDFDVPFLPSVEIGWIYKPAFWRRGFASEAACALFEHGFNELGLEEIVAFTAAINEPSAAVMRHLRMVRCEEDDFDHPMVCDDAAHLRPHVLYRMTSNTWEKEKGR